MKNNMKIDEKDRESLEEIQAFYDAVYYKDKVGEKRASRHLLALTEKLGVEKESQVLDVACGTGEWLIACRGKGAVTCGIDLSEKAITACRDKLPGGEFYVQPAEELPFEDGRFNFVTCLGSLEHFVAPGQALKEMARVADSSACIVILVPNSGFLTRRLGMYAGTNQVDAKEVVRSLEEWKDLFESSGLTVTKRWKDLHVLSWAWISSNGLGSAPVRFLQAIALLFWPLKWQYQVYHLCKKNMNN